MAVNRATIEIFARLRDGVSATAKGIKGTLLDLGRTLASTTVLRGFNNGLLGSAGAVAGIVALGKSAADSREKIRLMAQSVGESVEDLSRFKFALESIGKGDGLKEVLNQLAGQRGDATRGPGQVRTAFESLGVSLQKIRDGGGVEILTQLADAYAKAGDRAFAAAQLQAIFGDQYRELLPLFEQGAAGLKALADRSDALGATVSGSEAQRAQGFTRSWREFTTAVSGVVLDVGDIFGDFIDVILPEITGVIVSLRKLLEENRELAKIRDYADTIDKINPGMSPTDRDLIAGFALQLREQEEAFRKKPATEIPKVNITVTASGDTGAGEEILDRGFFEGLRSEIELTQTALQNMELAGRQTASALQSVFSSNITGVIRAVRQGAIETRDALDSLLDGLIEDFAEFFTQQFVQRLVGSALNLFFGASGGSGGNGRLGYGDIGTSPPPPSISGLGGGNFFGGFKRLYGGGSTINVYGAQTAEEQRATVSAILRDQIGRSRQVRVQLRGV